MRLLPFILLSAAVAAVPLMATPAFARQATRPASLDLDPGRLVADQVATLARQMVDPAGDQETRDAAAQRLLSISTAEARSAVQFALRDPGNNAGRLAAARAVADDLPPDPEFIDPLFVLLDAEAPRPLLDAAVVALGNYKSEPDVSTRLVRLTDANKSDAVRLAAIRALSLQVEKSAAKRLVELSQDPSPLIASTATDACRAFASMPLTSPADWWRTQADRPEDRFRFETLSARASHFENAARHGEETFQELRRRLLAELANAPREQRGDVMLRYLKSPKDSVRLIAVQQAFDYVQTGDLPPNCIPAIRSLLTDADPDVRYEAARTTFIATDADAFPLVAQQLAVEADPRVRAELARALGPIGNVQAVPLLRAALDDASAPVVQAAAESLKSLGPAVAQHNPRDAAELASKLESLIGSKGAGGGKLRDALVAALVPLGQKSSLPIFTSLLTSTPPESDATRQLAAAGIGAIHNPQTAGLLVDAIRDDNSPAVREQAVRALGAVSNTFENAEVIYRRMDPSTETSQTVRDAAWDVLKSLFELAPRQQLARWPDQPLIRNNPARRVDVFKALAVKAAQDHDADTESACYQQIGDSQMELGRYADATASYEQGLVITRQSNGSPMREQTLVQNVLKSQLRSRDYAGAVRFASDLFRGPNGNSNRGILEPEFKLEAERLANDANQLDDAMALIKETLAMTPGLSEHYRSLLVEVQRNVERRRGEKNELVMPQLMQALAMR